MTGNRIPDYCVLCGCEIDDGAFVCDLCAYGDDLEHPPYIYHPIHDDIPWEGYRCDYCGEEIESPFQKCPHCGHAGYG